ncbi:MAG TPA: glycosyltransferase [Candidatus Lustribacter sp.]|nr:glycosyltransferase [Candidatus Lustribacter sp.]
MLRSPSVENALLTDTPLQQRAVACFTECYRPLVNGVVASIDELRAGLEAAGVRVTIVAPHFPHESAGDNAVVRLPSLPLPTTTGYRFCVPYVSRAVRARVRSASIVHAHSPFVTGMLAADIARRSGIPLVYTYHTRIDEYAHYARFEPRLARVALTALTRAFANRAAAVIVPTRAMQQRLRDIGVRVPIAVVASAIDVARFAGGRRTAAARALLGACDGERIALCVARVAREKNLELAVDALARVPGVRLAIVGGGPDRAQLESRAVRLGVRERVHFTGALDPAALPDLYASSDAFVFPSTTETQGLVLAEASATGLPVAAVDTPVNREVLGGFGRLVAPDAVALAAGLGWALEQPRDVAAAADAGRRFGRASQTAAVMEVYESVSLCRTFGTPVREYTPG